MADVSLRSGLEYDRDLLRTAIEDMVAATGGWPASLQEGARVLLKVNMLSAKPPEKAITTHPEVVGALAELLMEKGCSVAVGDSPGGAIKGVERYWRSCGYLDLANELGLKLVNFEASGSVKRTVGGSRYHIAKPLFDYDAIINLCKFKTHTLCRLTNAVKNAFGAVPGLGKAIIHSHAVRPRDFAVHLVNIYSLVKFDLVVMDAVLCMDGRGPSTDGNPRWAGLLGVARDSVVLDMVMSKLVGLQPEELDTTKEARKQNLGKPWADIVVDGSHDLRDFRIPRTAFYNLVPSFVGSVLRSLMKKVPSSNENCTGCGFCAQSCPAGAIAIVDGRARMDKRQCILCLCCHELCPENAVTVADPLRRR